MPSYQASKALQGNKDKTNNSTARNKDRSGHSSWENSRARGSRRSPQRSLLRDRPRARTLYLFSLLSTKCVPRILNVITSQARARSDFELYYRFAAGFYHLEEEPRAGEHPPKILIGGLNYRLCLLKVLAAVAESRAIFRRADFAICEMRAITTPSTRLGSAQDLYLSICNFSIVIMPRVLFFDFQFRTALYSVWIEDHCRFKQDVELFIRGKYVGEWAYNVSESWRESYRGELKIHAVCWR